MTNLLSYSKLSLLISVIQAQRTRPDAGDHEGGPHHGYVLHEHNLLHARLHGICDGPEVVHDQRNGDEENSSFVLDRSSISEPGGSLFPLDKQRKKPYHFLVTIFF
jgi:hypothetical protein